MSVVPDALRRAVQTRAQGRCEYCLVHEADFHFAHEPDHVVAVQHGGATEVENLALACFPCNRRKGPNLSSIDPATGQRAWLFNPRVDRWSDHFRIEGPRIVGITPAGRATVSLLQSNSGERLRVRRNLQRAGRYPREA